MLQTFNVGARSRFVTATAWAFIVIGLLAFSSALVQPAGIASWLPDHGLAGASAPLPHLAGWLVAYLPWLERCGIALSIATLGGAAGLLLRLDWARRLFIGLMAVAIGADLLGLWLQHEVVQSLVDVTLARAPLPPLAAGVFDGFVTASRTMGAVVTLAACALLGWIIRRLMSPAVRQEFA